jgi:hypothetical protein
MLTDVCRSSPSEEQTYADVCRRRQPLGRVRIERRERRERREREIERERR